MLPTQLSNAGGNVVSRACDLEVQPELFLSRRQLAFARLDLDQFCDDSESVSKHRFISV